MAFLHHLEHAPVIPSKYVDPELCNPLEVERLPVTPLQWILNQPRQVTTLEDDVALATLTGTQHRHIVNPPRIGVLRPTVDGVQYVEKNDSTTPESATKEYGALILLFASIDRSGQVHYRCPAAVTTTDALQTTESSVEILSLGKLNTKQQQSAMAQRVLPEMRRRSPQTSSANTTSRRLITV